MLGMFIDIFITNQLNILQCNCADKGKKNK